MCTKAFTAKTFAWLHQVNRGRYLAIDLKVALQLTVYFNEKDQGGRAFPSCQTLGDDIGLSERTVRRSIDRLHKGGALRIIWGTQGRGHPHQYWMLLKSEKTGTVTPVFGDNKTGTATPVSDGNKTGTCGNKTGAATPENLLRTTKKERKGRYISQPADFFDEAKRTPEEGRAEKNLFGEAIEPGADAGLDSIEGSVAADDGGVCTAYTKPTAVQKSRPPNLGNENAGLKSEPSAATAFDQFWKIYPRRVAKEAARVAFDRAVKNGISVTTLIEGARRYAGERAGEPPKFTKHPATWLRGGCWEDEPAPRAGGPPVIDNATGELVPTPRPRGNGYAGKTHADIKREFLASLEARDGH